MSNPQFTEFGRKLVQNVTVTFNGVPVQSINSCRKCGAGFEYNRERRIAMEKNPDKNLCWDCAPEKKKKCKKKKKRNSQCLE